MIERPIFYGLIVGYWFIQSVFVVIGENSLVKGLILSCIYTILLIVIQVITGVLKWHRK